MDALKFHDLAFATRGTLAGVDPARPVIGRVMIDSREVRPGDIFWALPGTNTDGHHFLADALSRGASMLVIDQPPRDHLPAAPILQVSDTSRALWDLAGWYRAQHEALVVGVTGSVGKTSTRELLRAALSVAYPGMASPFNYNNEIGLPLTLLSLAAEHEFAVLEMGAGRRGDIEALCHLARPEIGVLTPVGIAHYESFGDLETIIHTKGELAAALPPSGFCVIAGDNPAADQMARRCQAPVIRLTGPHAPAHTQPQAVRVTWQGLEFRLDGQAFLVPVLGRHQLSNVLSAIVVAREVGIPLPDIADGLRQFTPVAGRCHVQTIGPWTVVDDSYNANPVSMQAATDLLRDMHDQAWQRPTVATAGPRLLTSTAHPSPARTILVVGDMLELGSLARDAHRELGRRIAASGVAGAVALGDYADDVMAGALAAGYSPTRLARAADWATLEMVLDCWLEPGDVLFVKGSRGMRMERVLSWLKDRCTNFESPRRAA